MHLFIVSLGDVMAGIILSIIIVFTVIVLLLRFGFLGFEKLKKMFVNLFF